MKYWYMLQWERSQSLKVIYCVVLFVSNIGTSVETKGKLLIAYNWLGWRRVGDKYKEWLLMILLFPEWWQCPENDYGDGCTTFWIYEKLLTLAVDSIDCSFTFLKLYFSDFHGIVLPFPTSHSQTFPSQLFSPACSSTSSTLFLQPRHVNWGTLSSVAYWAVAHPHLNIPYIVIGFPLRSGFLFLYYLYHQVHLSLEPGSHSSFLPYPLHGMSRRCTS